MFHSKTLHRPNLGLFILRLVTGLIFIYEGYMKLHGMPMTVGFFASIGFGAFWAYLVSIIELVGGIFMVIGYATQLFGMLLAIIMLVAIVKVTGHLGLEMSFTPILLGVSALSIAISGCGYYSLCSMIHGKKCAECKQGGKCACQHGQ